MQKPVVVLSIGMCMYPPAQKTQNDRSVYRLYAWATFLSSYWYSYTQRKEMPCLASMCTNAKRSLLFQVPICNAWAYVFLIMAQRSRILSCNTTFFSSVLVDFVDRKTEINLFQTGDDLWLWSDCSPMAGVCQSYVATLLWDCHTVTEDKLYKIEDQDLERYRTQGSSKYCENWNLNGNLNLSLSSIRLLYSAVIHLINFRGFYLKRKRRNLWNCLMLTNYLKESV